MLPIYISGGYGIRPYDFANNYLLDKSKFVTGRRGRRPLRSVCEQHVLGKASLV